MQGNIERKEGFTVAGIIMQDIVSAQCPDVWDRLFDAHSHEELSQLGNGSNYGICFDMVESGNLNYMAAYEISDSEKAVEMGLETMEILPGEYAVISLQGPVPEVIHEGWEYAEETFLPEHGLQHSGQPDLEVYGEGDMDSQDYEMELWIPVMKKHEL